MGNGRLFTENGTDRRNVTTVVCENQLGVLLQYSSGLEVQMKVLFR